MKEKLAIAQLRGTIFAPINIGYTPDNFNKFSEMLLPGAKACNANPPEMMIPGINPNQPQYGMPWRLFKKDAIEGDINIVFLPGKIDIILTKDIAYGGHEEKDFCTKCSELFGKILETHKGALVNRIAYAPLYAIKLVNTSAESVWGGFLKRTVIDGTPIQDVNFSFLLKREVQFNGSAVQMNFLHSFYDGIQIRQMGTGNVSQKVVLLQLDLNSIPESPLAFNSDGVKDFFTGILEVKDNLVDNVSK